MIQLDNTITPDTYILETLKAYQQEIDSLETFEQRSEKAKEIFSSRNKKGSKIFDAIKEKLTIMCSGARRCVYCEDSVADEVEHIHPKDLYPNLCFNWENYLYACRPCNGQKNKKFAIFRDDNQTFQVVNPPKGTKASEPPKGEAAIINPRIENQLDFCILDLKTFKFVSIKPKGSKDVTKAEYTYNEVLRLNERGVLRISRETAYVNYVSRLGYYTSEKEKGRPQKELDRMIENLKKEAHPTVWREMQRQSRMGILILIDKGLNELFIK